MQIKLLFALFFNFIYVFGSTTEPTDSLQVDTKKTTEAKYVFLPELDNKFPIPTSKKAISYAEFTFDRLAKEFPATPTYINDSKAEAEAGFREIDSTGRWIGSFRNEDIQVLPVGIKKEISGVEYQLGFTKARFSKDYTELTVFVKIILPQSDEQGKPIELFFGANNVKLSHQGGIIGDANLVLLGDMFIPFNGGNWLLILKGGFDYKTGNTANRTFVNITCNGVKEMGIEGELQFSRNIILPVGAVGETLPETRTYQGALKEPIQIPNRVSGAFRATASDWNDMIVEINLTPFVIASQPDKFMFSVNQAIFDFSDLRTENVQFPQYYHDQGLLLPNAETWRGVYVQSLDVSLPQEFKTEESISTNGRVSFQAANLLIDSYGVSGFFSATNVIPLESGRTSKSKAWAFSLDKIEIEVAANRLIGAGFDGRLVLPVSSLETTNDSGKLGLGYTGIISEEEYSLTVSTLDTINFDVFKAKAQLLPNSGVQLAVVDGNFLPKAVLNGRLAITANQKESLENEGSRDDEKTIQFKGIEFQNLTIQTVSPIVDVDYFGYKDEVKLANFPVSIADMELIFNDQEAGLAFDLAINLMSEDSKGFGASARLGIFGKFSEEGYRQNWKYDRIDISAIGIEAKLGKVGFSGRVEIFEDDVIYNDGFTGQLSLDLFDVEGLVDAKGLFGNKDGYRYFYVDFIGILPATVPIAPPVGLNAIGGGLSYNMERVSNDFVQTAQGNAAIDNKGLSLSGIVYEPNNEIGLDLRAVGFLGIQGSQAFTGKIMLSMLFDKETGRIDNISFDGYAELMVSANLDLSVSLDLEALKEMLGVPQFLSKITPNEVELFQVGLKEEFAKSSVKGDLSIVYDFENKTLHGESNIYISLVDGIVRGIGAEDRAGWMVFHVSPDEWYLHLGSPTDRLGLKMGIGSFSLETGAYFMMGSRIPGSPAPPQEVADILGVELDQLDYMRDLNALGDGKGFAFGADFKIDTGDLNFLILYARFQAGVGFDIMLKDYGDASCVNTGKKVGINGWYANGQSYAYLQGELGINIKLFFVRKKIPIIKGGAAILLQGKGPNPFWFRGYAGGYYDLLGGLVKGSYRMKVVIGEECELDNASPLGGIKMITDLSPRDGDTNIDVFAAPQAAFAMKINQPIIIPEDDGDKTYKVILERFQVVDASQKEIIGELEWGQMNDRATFISEDILPPDTKLTVTVEVSFQEKVNGSFKTILEDGQKAIEKEERTFTTGGAPDYIPLHNIQYAYPVVDQQLFYPDEYDTGYIQLQRGQDYLFDNTQWKSTVKYISETGASEESVFSYNTSDNKVSYALPDVDTETAYMMTIVSASKAAGSTSTGETTRTTQNYDDENTSEIRQNQAENVVNEGEIERLSYEFTSSEHKTFRAKIRDLNVSDHLWGYINSTVVFLSSKVESNEGFDLVELVGNTYTENTPLVIPESDLEDKYFGTDINPVIYQKYQLGSTYSISRDPSVYGYVPKRALPIISSYITNLENSTNLNLIATRFPFRYNLPDIYYKDYLDVRDRVINDRAKGVLGANAPELSIVSKPYEFMRYGDYTIKLIYTLPGGIKGTTGLYQYKNTINIR
ncbi:hypothetical protein GCM10022393_09600 [Aquimarina addita]|uniref:Cell surface protein SprA n=1 Tax=Aquimarina addita TaxID=870485 RepID=A0ABP7XDT9_9FLAO